MVKTYAFLPFTTPIIKQDEDLPHREKLATLGRFVEKICDIRGNKRPVSIISVSQVSNLVLVKSLPRKKERLLDTLLKIVAFVSLFPLILIIKPLYRALNKFIVEPVKFKKREVVEKQTIEQKSISKAESTTHSSVYEEELEEEEVEEEEDGDELGANISEATVFNDEIKEETLPTSSSADVIQEDPHEIIENKKAEENQKVVDPNPLETEISSTTTEKPIEHSSESLPQENSQTLEQIQTEQPKVIHEPENKDLTEKETLIPREETGVKIEEKPTEASKGAESLLQEDKSKLQEEIKPVEAEKNATEIKKPIDTTGSIKEQISQRKEERKIRREIQNPNVTAKKSASPPKKSSSTTPKTQLTSTAKKIDSVAKKVQPKKSPKENETKKTASKKATPSSKDKVSVNAPTKQPISVKTETESAPQKPEQPIQKVNQEQVTTEVALTKKEVAAEKPSEPLVVEPPKPVISNNTTEISKEKKQIESSSNDTWDLEARIAKRFKNEDPNAAKRNSIRFTPNIVRRQLDFDLLYSTGKQFFDNAKAEDEKETEPNWSYVTEQYSKALDCFGSYILEKYDENPPGITSVLNWAIKCFVALGYTTSSKTPHADEVKEVKYTFFRKKYIEYKERRIERDEAVVQRKLNRIKSTPFKEATQNTPLPSLDIVNNVNEVKIYNEKPPATQIPLSCAVSRTINNINRLNTYEAKSFQIQQTNGTSVDAHFIGLFRGKNSGLGIDTPSCAESMRLEFLRILKDKLDAAPSLNDLDI